MGFGEIFCGNRVVLAGFRHGKRFRGDDGITNNFTDSSIGHLFGRISERNLIAAHSYPNYVIYSSLYMYTVTYAISIPKINAR